MIAFSNCKINIGLFITSKRQDGFHNLETIFYPLPVCDILEIIPAQDATTMQVSGLQLEIPDHDNLCYRAYRMMDRHFKLKPVQIHLHKVPFHLVRDWEVDLPMLPLLSNC